MVRLTESIVYSRTKAAVDVVKKLNLWGCDIDNIELCARMVNLQILSLSMNRVSHLEPLKYCTRLEELYLRRNAISSLNELEHLKNLKHLRTLWIDENPCIPTINSSAHRSKVLKILPNLTKLDDKPVTMDDLLELQEDNSHDQQQQQQQLMLQQQQHQQQQQHLQPTSSTLSSSGHDFNRRGNSNCSESAHNNISGGGGGGDYGVIFGGGDERRQIVDTVIPSNTQMLNLVSSHSLNALDEDDDDVSPCATMHASMYDSIIVEDDGRVDEVADNNNWRDFTIEDRPHSPPAEMSMSMSMVNPQMFQSLYEGSQSARQSRAYRLPLSLQQRSISVPRRRPPSVSMSPIKRQRVEKIMSAVTVLLDELDGEGLRRVIDEAQRRIKKQR